LLTFSEADLRLMAFRFLFVSDKGIQSKMQITVINSEFQDLMRSV